MTARIAALHGRTIGLVQRRRRKMHFASIAPGDARKDGGGSVS